MDMENRYITTSVSQSIRLVLSMGFEGLAYSKKQAVDLKQVVTGLLWR